MSHSPDYPAGTRTLAWILVAALVAAGAVSLYQALMPIQLGDAEWEVGAVGQATSSGAVAALGWGGLAWLALTSPRLRWLARAMGFIGVAGAVAAGLGAVLVTTDIPLVWNAAKETGNLVQATAYKTTAVKAAALAGLYALFFLIFSAQILRQSFARR